jgi:oxaloacetate decarboxylase alpha subunit
MTTGDMLPLCEDLNKAGFYSMEVWGGATFDSCLRYLNEDPWERLVVLRKLLPDTKLQMLLRGQNILGYKHYSDDVVRSFVQHAIKNGIDIIRIFDALNDVRNMESSIKATKEFGGHAQGTVVYTISPVHNIDHYVETARTLVEWGVDSLCIKDMAGLLTPYVTYELVKRFKEEFKVPVSLHSHYTSGMASMAYLKAVEAGVDIIDTALSPLALGSSQPPTETLVAALQGTEYDTGIDIALLSKVSAALKVCKDCYPEARNANYMVDTNVLTYQIPGGMISNFVSQLGGQIDKLPEVLKEVPRVRADLGYPPLVTPSSQIVGSQAVLNVVAGERYKMVSNEVKNYLAGHYGRPPGKIDEDFRKRIIGDTEVIECRPADLIKDELPAARKEIAMYMEKEEDVLSYALFPQVALKYLKERQAKKYGVDFELASTAKNQGYPV